MFISLCIISFSYSQGGENSLQINGHISSEDNSPIEFANIYIKGTQKGTLSNAEGYFELKINLFDTLIISAVGYEPYCGLIKAVKEYILKAKIYELEKVTVFSGTPMTLSVGFNDLRISKSNIQSFTHGLIQTENSVINTGVQVASFINNPSSQDGIIKSVSFFMCKGGKNDAPFRIRIFASDDLGYPSEELTKENIIVTARINNDWFMVDLSQYKIRLPENGVFVSMEWLQTNQMSYWYEGKWKKFISKKVIN